MHRFDEHHPEFAGFSELFDREIAPTLRGSDGDRLEAKRVGRLLGAAGAITLSIALAALAWTMRHDEDV